MKVQRLNFYYNINPLLGGSCTSAFLFKGRERKKMFGSKCFDYAQHDTNTRGC